MDPSSINDPFAQLDAPRTFVKPNPGGRHAPSPLHAAQPAYDGEAAGEPAPPVGLNPLLALADRLLLLVPQLRHTRHVADPVALRDSLAQGIRDFVGQAEAAGIAHERVMFARYVLCTMIDEAAADTPWGGSGVWAGHSLLAMFHNETGGGERVFQLMARLAEKPAANRDLLELIYAALALGFEGRYRVIDNGRAQLDAVRDKLAQIVRQQRGAYPAALAEHWAAHPAPPQRALSWLPLAACAALAVLLLFGVHTGLSLALNEQSDPVAARIRDMRLAPPVAVAPQAATKPRLAQFLQSDIKAGLLAVSDEVDRSVITIRGDGLFPAGSAALLPERRELIERIADALALAGGAVLVTGHTDSQPIRSARFPSNWHLSEERARAVRDLLVARKVPADRVQAEGLAESRPVAGNDSPGSRALNRRVEITLLAARAGKP